MLYFNSIYKAVKFVFSMAGWKKTRGIVFVVSALLFVSVVVAQDSFFDVFFDVDFVDDFEKDCRRDCKNPREAVSMCNDKAKDEKNQCDEARDEAREDCEELRGRDRSNCRRSANDVRRECRDVAQDMKRECLQGVKGNKELCELQCKFNSCELLSADSDRDGVLDLFDNCPLHMNEDQNDVDGNGVGDACDGVFCCTEGLLGGNCFFADDIRSCREQGGAVMNCLPPEEQDDAPVEVLGNFTSVPVNANDVNVSDLLNNVTETGINNTAYVPGIYECADFAQDLETNLTARGYDATFTAFWCYGGVGNPAPTAHAVVDVHLDDGRTVWIEPQTGRLINMDMDGDGNVEVNNGAYTPGANMGQTDDNCKISVFADRAAANAAGVPGA
jgi:hypothetical protein